MFSSHINSFWRWFINHLLLSLFRLLLDKEKNSLEIITIAIAIVTVTYLLVSMAVRMSTTLTPGLVRGSWI